MTLVTLSSLHSCTAQVIQPDAGSEVIEQVVGNVDKTPVRSDNTEVKLSNGLIEGSLR